ncbi:hypothetical protein K7X08_018843 [Anisodus acutangulus]|uniref:Cell morphogenesis central region domain-containing protein n=1 Tax=Anisodus acutangulus TaxID=402998 RepID=A0A9Q1LZ95_9SOLA|nr:hypothetical protein K7X08_018843 [Anisodus acutangulus]
MPPELNIVPSTAGRSGQLLPSLVDMSGPLMGVGSSTGSRLNRHVSRDSGDYHIDTPNSGEEGLHLVAGTHAVNAKELQSALQGHQQHLLTHADIALILLAEIAYENDEDFREHLPLLFHVTFVSMDSSEGIVLEHCQHLLVNLLYSLAGRHLELYDVENSDGENKQQVVSLIKYVQSKRGSMMWENEDTIVVKTELPSAALLSALVQSMVDAIFFQGDLPETWGAEALKWAMECTSRHLACRSHQIYRALRPRVTNDACVSLLRCLHSCLSNPVPAVLGFVMEILLTLQVLELVYRVIDRLSFRDRTENVLLSSIPRDEVDSTVGDSSDFQRLESRNANEPLPSNAKALLQHTPMDAAQSPHMYAIVSQLVESTLCGGTCVLEALLQTCSLPGSHPHELGQFESGPAGAEEKILAPQTSFKARSGSLQFAMLGFGAGSTPVAQPNASESGLSAKELALQNTRLMLGRVLDSCAPGRKDYRRLVPFVTSTGNP